MVILFGKRTKVLVENMPTIPPVEQYTSHNYNLKYFKQKKETELKKTQKKIQNNAKSTTTVVQKPIFFVFFLLFQILRFQHLTNKQNEINLTHGSKN